MCVCTYVSMCVCLYVRVCNFIFLTIGTVQDQINLNKWLSIVIHVLNKLRDMLYG